MPSGNHLIDSDAEMTGEEHDGVGIGKEKSAIKVEGKCLRIVWKLNLGPLPHQNEVFWFGCIT